VIGAAVWVSSSARRAEIAVRQGLAWDVEWEPLVKTHIHTHTHTQFTITIYYYRGL
jgi:hypothetical protein